MPVFANGDFGLFTDIPTDYELEPLNSTYYCFGFITTGILNIKVDGVDYSMDTTSMLVYRPGQQFKVAKIANGTKGAFVLFTKKFLDALEENIFSVKEYSFLSRGVKSYITLSSTDFKKLQDLFFQIFKLLTRIATPQQEYVAKNLASALVYETDTILENYIAEREITECKQQDIIDRFTQMIDAYYKTSRKVSFYASKLNITANYLSIVVKRATGSSPATLINQRIIAEAQKMIVFSGKTVSEVAYGLNFNDPFIFSKFFKKHTGVAPIRYRKNHSDSILTCDIDS